VSRLPFELFLALRYLRPKRTFVSIITIISIIGVMLGVAVLMIVIAVMSGFDREWREKILSANAHLKVKHESGLMRDYRKVLAAVTNFPHVRGASPYIETQVMMETQPSNTNELPLISGPVLRGIDPEREGTVSVLPRRIVAGEFDLSGHGLVMGSAMAHELGVRVGDHVSLMSAGTLAKWKKSGGKQNESVLPDDFTVRGLFNVGFDDFDRMMIFTSLETAQDLQNIDGMAHGITVMLDKAFLAEEVGRAIERALPPEFYTSPWMKENRVIFNALATEKTMMYIILFVVMVVAAFAIVNSEITFAVNKIKEIGLLKSLGASNRQVMWIFLGHSIAIGVLGVGLGFVLGRVFLANLNNILDGVGALTGFSLLPAEIYKISRVPYELLWHDMAIICGGSFLICTLAGLLPAWKASRLQPVEALRNE
jgi:lipoprotein-releasing system permease protein